MKRVLVSAFACDPAKGSEAANGWNWVLSLEKFGYEVTCITRKLNQASIESHPDSKKLSFVYVDLGALERAYSYSLPSMYLYYLLWQKKASKIAKEIHEKASFDIVHHVTWGSIQLGSFMYKLNIPFVFGPVGGGQKSPELYKKYFGTYWSGERKRNMVSSFLERFNPGFKASILKCKTVLVANSDTYNLVKKYRDESIFKTYDFALPENFFPGRITNFRSIHGKLNLLWVGRFMPRKGLMLVMDVMLKLKAERNICLTIVGDGEMKELLIEFIKVHQLQNVYLTGRVTHEEVKELYLSHDAFFFTSLRDSCPVQLLEAMAFGLPVITLDLHGQAEIVNEETGIKVPVVEPEETVKLLTSAIISLTADEVRFNRMRHAAFDFARNHTWDKKVKDLTEKFYPKP